MQKITYLWISLIIILVLFLTILGINITKKNKPYKDYENDIVEAMKVYYGQDSNLTKLPKNKDIVKVTQKELEDFGLNINISKQNENCEGYGITKSKNMSFEYKAYIKCNDYTTKDYDKFK